MISARRDAVWRALLVWFRFEVFREWIDQALDDTLGRKWEAPTSGGRYPGDLQRIGRGLRPPASSGNPVRERQFRFSSGLTAISR
jgi:hypothetical protein